MRTVRLKAVVFAFRRTLQNHFFVPGAHTVSRNSDHGDTDLVFSLAHAGHYVDGTYSYLGTLHCGHSLGHSLRNCTLCLGILDPHLEVLC